MGVNKAAMKSPHFLLKILALVFTIITLALARHMQVLLTGTDGLWLIHATTVGAAIALCLFIITYLLGDSLPLRTETMFVLIYAVMFLAAGGILIEKYNPMQNTTGRDKGLALGSMAIIAGVVMFVDFVLLVKQIVKK